MIVLIPAYEPDERLVTLVRSLSPLVEHVLIVNDGSSKSCDGVFTEAEQAGAVVISLSHNRGKGFALKQGFSYVMQHMPHESVVCADCDGQHTPDDILEVADELAVNSESMVLGVRTLVGDVPFRSRFGNDLTRHLFSAATRVPLRDTQTGLRAYAAELLPWLCSVGGDRFEYELSVLLEATRLGIPVTEVPIETVYLEANCSSHFRPLVDSVRVYWPLLKFAMSSLSAFVIDTVALLVLHSLTGSLVLSAVTARAISSSTNFVINRTLVFRDRQPKRASSEALQYWLLVSGLLVLNVSMLAALTWLGLQLLLAKVFTEAALFAGSFGVQRRFIFARTSHNPSLARAHSGSKK